jgi:carbonic anhydrase
LDSGGDPSSKNLRSIVDRVRPALEPLMSTSLAHDRPALLREATRANVRVSADHLRHGSRILEQFIHEDGLVVVGAEYDLATGHVEFFDGMDAPALGAVKT